VTSSRIVASARGVGRRFGAVEVVQDVDLDVAAGEVVGVVGPNGGGKSTLLLLLAGLVRPTAGVALVEGIPAHEVARQRTGAVGLITAEPGLYPLLTGRENLAFFGGLYGLSPEDVARRSESARRALALEGELDRAVFTYSSGMRQKLSLLRALLMDPVLLLLDEPTANLDPVSARALDRGVREQADAGRAVVWVTHDLAAAEAICDRVVFLDGRIRHVEVLDGPRRVPAPGRLLSIYASLAGPT
jgi:ABC-2 type transport system ATP-binding protein